LPNKSTIGFSVAENFLSGCEFFKTSRKERDKDFTEKIFHNMKNLLKEVLLLKFNPRLYFNFRRILYDDTYASFYDFAKKDSTKAEIFLAASYSRNRLMKKLFQVEHVFQEHAGLELPRVEQLYFYSEASHKLYNF